MLDIGNFHRSILDQLDDAIAVVDAADQFCFVNQSFAELHHAEVADFEGKLLSDLRCAPMAQNGQVRHRMGDGSEKLLVLHSQPFAMGDEGAAGRLLRAREAVSSCKAANSEALFVLLACLPDVVIGLDASFNYRYVSSVSRLVCGYDAEELIGRDSLEYVVSADREKVRAAYRCALDKGSPIGVEFRRLRKDGSDFPVESYGRPAPDSLRAEGIALICVVRDTTRRTETEIALRESEYRYRLLAEHATDMIALASSDLRYEYVSPACSRLLGYAAEELVGCPVSQFVHPEDWVHIEKSRDELKVEEPRAFTYRRKKKDGSWIWLESNVRRYAEPGATEAQGYVVVARDATERVAREAALAERESLFRQIVENINGVFWLHDSQGLLYVNTAYERLWERSRESLYAKPGSFLEAVHPDDRGRVARRRYESSTDRAAYFDEEYRIVRKDGSIHWIWARCFPIQHGADAAWRIAGFAEDVTARRAAQVALRESEARYRLLAENATDLIGKVDTEGNILQLSPMLEGFSGYTAASLIGRSLYDFVYEPDRPLIRGAQAALQRGGRRPSARAEFRLRRKDGSLLWVEATGKLVTATSADDRGEVVIVVRDISRRKAAEEQIRAYNEDLESMVNERTVRIHELERQRMHSEHLAATSRMAAYIAHEINNPLAGVKNAFHLVRRAVPAEHKYSPYLGLIDQELERMEFIVRQMFALHRSDHECPRMILLHSVFEEVVTLLERKCRQSEVAIRTSLPAGRREIMLPEVYLRQILFNLLSNAVEASSAGGTIGLAADMHGDLLEIEVQDHGEGMTQEVEAHAFEPFYSTKSDECAGMGLGLAITRDLVSAMDGTITLETAPGRGCRFSIRIPLADANGS
ncbi:MAG: PAS domain S-box protein [Candidatus Hydrogenedens sp.]|nr:PAS domain S-box protein [Candidatus Hydrogenedens sp.]